MSVIPKKWMEGETGDFLPEKLAAIRLGLGPFFF